MPTANVLMDFGVCQQGGKVRLWVTAELLEDLGHVVLKFQTGKIKISGWITDWLQQCTLLSGKWQRPSSNLHCTVVLLHEGHSFKQTDFLYLGFCIGVSLCRERNLIQGGSEERIRSIPWHRGNLGHCAMAVCRKNENPYTECVHYPLPNYHLFQSHALEALGKIKKCCQPPQLPRTTT